MSEMIDITKEQFESLKREAADIVKEREVEYGYETLLDRDGAEIAFASYHSYKPTTYTRFDPPRQPAPVEE